MGKMILTIDVRLATVDDRGFQQSNGIEIREHLTINADTFLEAAKVLGQFHDLAETLRNGKL